QFSPAFIDMLTRNLRNVIARIRQVEREIMAICVRKCKMPRKVFIDSFPNKETQTDWLKEQIKAGASYSPALKEHAEEIESLQQLLIDIETESGLTISDIKEINRQMSIGEAKARRAKKEMVEANLRL